MWNPNYGQPYYGRGNNQGPNFGKRDSSSSSEKRKRRNQQPGIYNQPYYGPPQFNQPFNPSFNQHYNNAPYNNNLYSNNPYNQPYNNLYGQQNQGFFGGVKNTFEN